jgi:fructose-1,6-bisphosphatase II
MWFKDEESRKSELEGSVFPTEDLDRVFNARDIVPGDSALFCATGITDSALLPGVKLIGRTAITHSILMRARSKTVRYIRAVHDLDHKTIHLRSESAEHKI